ncbi:hypothetical protein GRI44_02465 [Altererythrobacter confluentis]|uniref:HEAT repeat protein n=1 Tax=Allopontixanthobacter confluentis TaxID=1849021 RepID=A0A6L7GCI8_9SPHN|nr:HEAT repeat domain-containing protein [Allopontixanthobacter confluentis]MXP13617.1 hypothetical protein [Allopontixanthobacter confluentis]
MNGYSAIIHFCIWSSVAMAVAFAALVLRRFYTERGEPISKARQTAITRSYLQRVQGFSADTKGAQWKPADCMNAVSHLLLLLRGGEREILVQLAEQDGLLEGTLRLSHARRPARRIDAVRILQQFGGALAEQRLTQMLADDGHNIVRLNAAFALAQFGKLPPPRETIAMLGMQSRTPTSMDVAMLRAMAPDHAAQLHDMLDETMPSSRRAAIIDALGWSADMSVLPMLEQAAYFNDVDVQCSALRAAAKLGHPSVSEWVIRALDDCNPNVRTQAINSCASLGLVEAVPMIHRLTSDPEFWVRLRAGEALDQLAPDMRRIATSV